MIRIVSPADMHRFVARAGGGTRGLVATMGALHAGHEALLQLARRDNDVTVLSLFVNPAQFNVASDYETYPRTIERDLRIAEHHGVDAVYMPTVESMYPPGFASHVEPATSSVTLEGAGRPGHFRGVTTVVAKLFNAVAPHRAYFGKKDYQQLAVIRQMVQELDFPVEVVGVETVRDADGLALSSRNVRLSASAREDAPVIHRGLSRVRELHRGGLTSTVRLKEAFDETVASSSLIRIEYAEIVDARTLTPIDSCVAPAVMCVAAWYDDVRLIDNVELIP